MWLLNLFYVTSGSLALLITALYVFQRKLIYFPDIPTPRTQMQVPKHSENVRLISKDGTKIHGFLMNPGKSKTILMCQANAGNIVIFYLLGTSCSYRRWADQTVGLFCIHAKLPGIRLFWRFTERSWNQTRRWSSFGVSANSELDSNYLRAIDRRGCCDLWRNEVQGKAPDSGEHVHESFWNGENCDASVFKDFLAASQGHVGLFGFD